MVGVASESSDRGIAFGAKHGISYLGNCQRALQDSEFEAVYISAANKDHEIFIEMAINANKHVLCEKPLVLNAASMAKLFKLSKERKLILVEGLMYRFHPQILTLLNEVRSGRYGLPLHINATFSFDYGLGEHLDRRIRSGGGALPDLGCYLVDFANLIAKNQTADSVRLISKTSPVSFNAMIEYSQGLTAEIRASMDRPSINTWEVICEGGSISANRFNPHEETVTTVNVINEESQLRVISVSKEGSGLAQFKAEFDEFYNAIKGAREPFVSADECIRNAKILDKISDARLHYFSK